MMAIDTDNSKLWFGLNGKWGNNSGSGNPELGTNALLTNLNYAVYPYIMAVSDSATDPCHGILNCGQKPFHYPPPKGFETISVPNTPTNVVLPTKYFTPTLYSGTGSGPQNVDAGFKPDMVWIKSRNNAWYWNCYDSVRGSGKPGTDDAAYYIGCNDNSVQTNVNAVSGTQFQGFYGANQSGGYIPHYYTGGSGQELNTSGATYVGYCWKAGGGTGAGGEFWKDDKQYASAAAAGLDGGSITPTGASVGTRQGFSIIKYSGTGSAATISHGLSSAPQLIISKRIDNSTSNWGVYHSSLGPTKVILLNSSNAQVTADTPWNDTSPTSSVWSVKSSNTTNNSGDNYIAYLWADIPGVQKFGKYAGSGNNNGSVVELGFRPALVWVKSYDTAGQEWVVWDDKRAPYNEINTFLYLEQNIADNGDGADRKVDFLSNGFKFRDGSSGATDYSGRNYIYCAWAEQPEYNLYGGQSNAR